MRMLDYAAPLAATISARHRSGIARQFPLFDKVAITLPDFRPNLLYATL
jgi:hypothetical protein